MTTEIYGVEFTGAEEVLAKQKQIDDAILAGQQRIADAERTATVAVNERANAHAKAIRQIQAEADAQNKLEASERARANKPSNRDQNFQSQLAREGLDQSGAIKKTELTVGGLADKFKAVSRDIGTAGGAVAQFATHAADEVLSVADAVGAGGLVGAIALAALAGKGISLVFEQWIAESEKAEQAAMASAQAEISWMEQTKESIKNKTKLITASMQEELAAELQFRELKAKHLDDTRVQLAAEIRDLSKSNDERAVILEKQSLNAIQIKSNEMDIKKAMADKAASTEDAILENQAADGVRAAEQETRLQDARDAGRVARLQRMNGLESTNQMTRIQNIEEIVNVQNRADQYTYDNSSKEEKQIAAQRIANRWAEANAAIEAIKREANARAKAAEDDLIERNRMMKQGFVSSRNDEVVQAAQIQFNATRKVVDMEGEYATKVREGSVAIHERAMDDARITLAGRTMHLRAIAEIREEEAKAATEKKVEAIQLLHHTAGLSEEAVNQQVALIRQTALLEKDEREKVTEFTIRQEQRKQDEIGKTAVASVAAAMALEGYGATMFLVGAATDALTEKMQAFGDVNRENYREFFQFTEDTPDMVAKQVQAFLWGIALQSGQKAIFETAEELKETALGFGSLAMLDAPGAAMHFQSAAVHAVAATAYGVISGGAAIGAGGIAASRGEGGLFGLTNEEREAQKKKKEADSRADGKGPRDGPSAGGAGSRGEAPVVRNTYIYEAGAIDANNRRNIASVVNVGILHRDGFMDRDRERANP